MKLKKFHRYIKHKYLMGYNNGYGSFEYKFTAVRKPNFLWLYIRV